MTRRKAPKSKSLRARMHMGIRALRRLLRFRRPSNVRGVDALLDAQFAAALSAAKEASKAVLDPTVILVRRVSVISFNDWYERVEGRRLAEFSERFGHQATSCALSWAQRKERVR